MGFAKNNLNEKSKVADFVSVAPATSQIFEKYHIDFCCHGNVSLDSVCQEYHLETESLLAELVNVSTTTIPQDDSALPSASPAFATDNHKHEKTGTAKDWTREENLHKIVDHILDAYHAPLKPELTRLEGVFGKVVRKHGHAHPQLKRMEEIFDTMVAELRVHLEKEETVLFPYMREIYITWIEGSTTAVEDAPSIGTKNPFESGSVQNPIHQIEHEHTHAGNALTALRELSHDYTLPVDACASFQALYEGLEQLEKDLHRHIHLENYVLHPLAIKMERENRTTV